MPLQQVSSHVHTDTSTLLWTFTFAHMFLCEVSERVASEDVMAFGTYMSDVILVLEDAEV